MKKIGFLLILVSLFGSLHALEKKVLICDLGGLFFDFKGFGFGMAAVGKGSKAWGLAKTMYFAVRDTSNPAHLEKKLFAVLEQFPVKAEKGFKPACKNSGSPMPYPLCAYQAGRVTSQELREKANEVCDRLSQENFFVSPREEEIIRRILVAMFTPEFQAQFNYAYPQGIELLKNAAEAKDFKIVALSNWDKESFAIVRKEFKKEFEYFDDVVISGDIGTVKPNNKAYEFVLKKLELQGFKKEDCVFIDDQKENVDAANGLGITAILVNRGDAASLKAALEQFGFIQQKPSGSLWHRMKARSVI